MATRIPKQIWQTYKTASLPVSAVPCVRSWKRRNPTWSYRFFDDGELDGYVRANGTAEEYAAFRQLPLGVMKADFWRYFVLLKEGGVYADIDTVASQPVEDWIGNGTALVTGVEDTRELFCQWAIAAPPGHPVLRHAIDLILERVNEPVDVRSRGAVHHITGPQLWTDAISRHLGIAGDVTNLGTASAERIQLERDLWTGKAMLIHPWQVLCGGAVSHLFASKRWSDLPGYASWRVLRNRTDGTRAVSEVSR